MTDIVGGQNRDLYSSLTNEWRQFVANGLTEVPTFVRPPSARFYEPPELCVACMDETPHLVFSCGHAPLCAKCLDSFLRKLRGRHCPICRE